MSLKVSRLKTVLDRLYFKAQDTVKLGKNVNVATGWAMTDSLLRKAGKVDRFQLLQGQ